MPKYYARFLTPAFQQDASTIKTTEHTLQYIEFDESTTARLWEQIDEYELQIYSSWTSENDDYGTSNSGSDVDFFKIKQLYSISSDTYATNSPQADCLIIGGQFVGLVIKITEEGGGTWTYSKSSSYCILYTDGRVMGKNCSYTSYAGESSSHETEKTYSIHKKS